MNLTRKQQLLLEWQEEEPLMTYVNPKTGMRNFGKARLRIADVYTTLSMRPLFERGLVVVSDQEITVTMADGTEVVANTCKITEKEYGSSNQD